MSDEAIQESTILIRQCLQMLDLKNLTWPSNDSLRHSQVQESLYVALFDEKGNHFLAPERYRFRVLKSLVAKIEESVVDPDEDVSRQCISYLSSLISFSHAKCLGSALSDLKCHPGNI